jgi:hypothetical protein
VLHHCYRTNSPSCHTSKHARPCACGTFPVFCGLWVCFFSIPKILAVADILIVSFVDVSCLGVAGPERELGCVSLLQSSQSSI